jgi:hypothetical protein
VSSLTESSGYPCLIESIRPRHHNTTRRPRTLDDGIGYTFVSVIDRRSSVAAVSTRSHNLRVEISGDSECFFTPIRICALVNQSRYQCACDAASETVMTVCFSGTGAVRP